MQVNSRDEAGLVGLLYGQTICAITFGYQQTDYSSELKLIIKDHMLVVSTFFSFISNEFIQTHT